MTLIVDAGALFAQADRKDPAHDVISSALRAERGPLITSQVALAEADYLILDRLGLHVEAALFDDLHSGTFIAECLQPDDFETVRTLGRKYRDLKPGLADLSLVILARRHRTKRILTVDERCFRAMKPLQGGSFQILPADGFKA
ncbi:MAG: hypothetical protein NVSMB57_06690 [Actinomycetota bacterium]